MKQIALPLDRDELVLRVKLGWIVCLRPSWNLRCFFSTWSCVLHSCRFELEDPKTIVKVRAS